MLQNLNPMAPCVSRTHKFSQLNCISDHCTVGLYKGDLMKRNPRLPLTETVYYVLLALIEPAHGYLIMSRVEAMSNGAVRMAPGTMYGALENLSKQRMIEPVTSLDPRRKVYQITESGYQTLAQDSERMRHLVHVFEQTTKDMRAE